MWFLFEEVSSSPWCLGWAALFYCCTPWDFHIIILIASFPDLCIRFTFTQLVTHPKRFDNILALFLIVKSVEIKPGITDHDMVLSEVFIKPQVNKQKPRLMSMYKKVDWEGFEKHMLSFQKSFLVSHEGKSIN